MSVESGRLQGRALAWRVVAAATLTGAALLVLFPGGRWALKIDATPAALGSTAAPSDQEQVIVAGFADGGVDAAAIEDLAALEMALRGVPGVRGTRSVASVKIPFADAVEIRLDSLRERLAAAGPDRALIEQTLDDSLIRGHLASRDGRAVAILVDLHGDPAARLQTAARLAELIEARPAGPLRWVHTGPSVVSGRIGTLLLRQMAIVLPAAVLVFSLLVLLAFRQAMALIASLAGIATALLWTLAAATALGWALNLVTIVIPPLVLTLTVSYAMHVVSAHADRANLAQGLQAIRWPLAFSTLTTAIGLAALGFNPLASVRQFAALGVVGTVAAALSVWIVLPLLLSLARRPPSLWPPIHGRLQALADRIVALVVSHSRAVIRIGLLLLALCLAAATLVNPGARYVHDLPADEPVRQAYEQISAAFGGANRIDIEVLGSAPDALLAPEVLASLDALQGWLLAQPEIGGTRWAGDFLKRLHQDFAGEGRPEAYRLPDKAVLGKQLIYFAAPDEIYRFTNRTFSRMRLEVRTPLTDTPQLRALLNRIEARLAELPPGLDTRLGGSSVELTEVIEDLTGGQLRSLGASGLAIFGLLSLLFASARVGAMAMLPNALPVVAYFALLGVTGTPLSPTTALVACIVLGIAVDDTLHLLVRFSRLARDMADEEQASRAAVSEVLRPITLTTTATCLGFLMLVSSPFHSQMMFGLLAALTLLLAWISDLLLAPAVSARSSIVTLWDHLRLDLGGNPLETIPLMADMSERQARQFALNSTIRRIPARSDLIRQGEYGKEMFVVLDGMLRVWTGENGGAGQELARVGRGETLGEVGHFAARRAASVTAEQDARVLVLDADMLERLRIRHPRVAALVYRNLNRIQAQRTLAEAGPAG